MGIDVSWSETGLSRSCPEGCGLGDRDGAGVCRRGGGWVAIAVYWLGSVGGVLDGGSGGDAGDGHIDGRLVVTAVGRKAGISNPGDSAGVVG